MVLLMAVIVNKFKKPIILGAATFVVSSLATYATGWVPAGYVTAAICGSSLFCAQKPSTSFWDRFKQSCGETLEKVNHFLRSFQLSNIQTVVVALGSVVGAHEWQVLVHDNGLGWAIIGGTLGGAATFSILNYKGMIRPMNPPTRLNPNVTEITPASLLHLDSPCTLRVSYTYFKSKKTVSGTVACSSAGSAIECAKLNPEFREKHKCFFESADTTADECRAFVLSRPASEIDPDFNLAVATEHYNYMKFGLRVPSTDKKENKPELSEEQKSCREALLATDGTDMIYPVALFPNSVIPRSIERAAILAVDQIKTAALRVALALPTQPGIIWSSQDRESAVREAAQAGARKGAETVACELAQKGKFVAGVPFAGAFAGAMQGVQAGVRSALTMINIGNGLIQAELDGEIAGRQAGLQLIINGLALSPILINTREHPSLAYQLTLIREQLKKEIEIEQQDADKSTTSLDSSSV